MGPIRSMWISPSGCFRMLLDIWNGDFVIFPDRQWGHPARLHGPPDTWTPVTSSFLNILLISDELRCASLECHCSQVPLVTFVLDPLMAMASASCLSNGSVVSGHGIVGGLGLISVLYGKM